MLIFDRRSSHIGNLVLKPKFILTINGYPYIKELSLDKVIEDKELGRLVVHVNARARRLIFRTKNNEIVISVPPHTSTKK